MPNGTVVGCFWQARLDAGAIIDGGFDVACSECYIYDVYVWHPTRASSQDPASVAIWAQDLLLLPSFAL